MATKKHKVWSQKHYNAVAKEIREVFPIDSAPMEIPMLPSERRDNNIRRGTLSVLALSLCKRFKEDSDEATAGLGFDPIKFLDACSPNSDLYPLSELWEGDQLG